MERKFEELNNEELIKVIYKEILEIKEKMNNKTEEKIDRLENKVNKIDNKVDGLDNKVNAIDDKVDKVNKEMKEDIKEIKSTLDEHTKILDEHTKTLAEHSKILTEHTKILNKHTKKLEEHDEKFANLENQTDKICKNLDDLGKTEKLHFEYTTNKFNRIEQKIDSNFKYLDEKIDTTKNNLVSETSDILETFSLATTKSIKNIENKIDNEKNERMLDIGQIKGLNDYNKIILRNLESRISILEEESEKYNLN